MAVELATSLQWDYALIGPTLSQVSKSGTVSEVLTRDVGRRPPPTAMSIRGHEAFFGLRNRNVEVWDLEKQHYTTTLTSDGEESQVNAVASQGNMVLVGTNQVTLYKDSQPEIFWNHHTSPVQTVAFINEHSFSSGSEDALVIWDIRKGGKALQKFEANISTHYWFGSHMVSAGTDGVVKHWTQPGRPTPPQVERLIQGVKLSLDQHLSTFNTDLTELLVQNKKGKYNFIKLD